VLPPYIATNHSPSSIVVMVSAVAVLVSGCSFLIDAGRDQCSSNADCSRLELGGTCENGVCVAPRAPGINEPDEMKDRCDGGECEPADGGMDAAIVDPGCSVDPDCESDERCYKGGCETEAVVERFICDPPVAMRTATVPFRMAAREFASEQPPKGLKASACNRPDLTCKSPVATFEDATGMGVIEMELPFEFSGFLQVLSSETLPALWYFTRPLIAPRVAKDLAVVAPASLDLLAAITGQTVMASKGLVVLEAFDCTETAVGGIHFEENTETASPFYIVDGLPNTASNITVRDERTNNAPGGFLNATPGFTVFTAHIGVDGPVLGEFNGHVRAGAVTYLDIYP
jgi:hypothetical protein